MNEAEPVAFMVEVDFAVIHFLFTLIYRFYGHYFIRELLCQ
jgi:hypothetical protein